MAETLFISANLLPIGTYFCVLGLIHASRRPLVTTGIRDFLALAVALSGLVINIPLTLVLHSNILPINPIAGSGIFLYCLIVLFTVPRYFGSIVVYNAQLNDVVAKFEDILQRLDLKPESIPGGWVLLDRTVKVEIDPFPALNNVAIQFRGAKNPEFISKIRYELADTLAEDRSSWTTAGWVMAVTGTLILAFPVWELSMLPGGVVKVVQKIFEAWLM